MSRFETTDINDTPIEWKLSICVEDDIFPFSLTSAQILRAKTVSSSANERLAGDK